MIYPSRLAAEIGEPPKETDIIGIMQTARCGSTLVAQLFKRVPGTLMFNEPYELWHLQDHFLRGNIKGGMEECKRIIRSCMRIHCKHLKAVC